MKRLFLLLVPVVLLAPTHTWAKGGSYTRKAPIPIVTSMATPAVIPVRDVQRQASSDCGGVCHNRNFRRAKASIQ